jgi:hypothetical protein
MAERESGILIDPRSGIIRTSVPQPTGHMQSGNAQMFALQTAGRIEKSC